MDRSDISNMIKLALLKDVDLTEEEYKAKRLENDKQTEKNGYTGKASLKETVRARRMAMNFYGTILNILVNMHATSLEMLAEQKQTNRLLSAMFEMEGENGDK